MAASVGPEDRQPVRGGKDGRLSGLMPAQRESEEDVREAGRAGAIGSHDEHG